MESWIEQTLAKVWAARSPDEAADIVGELAKLARQNPDPAIEHYYHSSAPNKGPLVECLRGLTEPRVIELFLHAMKSREWPVRWSAIQGLACSADPALIPVFIAALKDRAHMVKIEALEWLEVHGDARAIPHLERLVKLPRVIQYSPGMVDCAMAALAAIRANAGPQTERPSVRPEDPPDKKSG